MDQPLINQVFRNSTAHSGSAVLYITVWFRAVDSLMCELLMRSALCIQPVRSCSCSPRRCWCASCNSSDSWRHYIWAHTADSAAVIRISINHEEWSGHMPRPHHLPVRLRFNDWFWIDWFYISPRARLRCEPGVDSECWVSSLFEYFSSAAYGYFFIPVILTQKKKNVSVNSIPRKAASALAVCLFTRLLFSPEAVINAWFSKWHYNLGLLFL